jgi:hypothetical protein
MFLKAFGFYFLVKKVEERFLEIPEIGCINTSRFLQTAVRRYATATL